jgi:ectoine hydroxylase
MKNRETPVVWRVELSEELRVYHKLGYNKKKAFFDTQQIDSIKRDALQLRESLRHSEDPGLVYEKDKITIRSIYGLHILGPDFLNTLLTPELVAMAENILGPDVYIHQARVHFKPAHLGQGYNWHSDFTIWRWEDGMMEPRCVNFMIPLDEMRPENGPLQVVPGSHLKDDVIVWESEVHDGENTYREYSRSSRGRCRVTTDQMKIIESSPIDTIISNPGELFYFDANILHMSEINTSPWDRMVIFIAINSMHNKLENAPNGKKPRSKYVSNRNYKQL